jgi:homoprotocatechuate degradation regulator HpaR
MRASDQSLPLALLRARESAMAFFRPVLNANALTEQQWRVMRILTESQSLEFHALAEKSCILPPSLTGILTRLERTGLVRRRRLAADQRRLIVTLSARGRKRVARVSSEVEARYREIEASFGTRRMAALLVLLRGLVRLRPRAPLRPRASAGGH